MIGDISVSDYTVLFLVCNHMAEGGTTDLIELNEELERMIECRLLFESHRERLNREVPILQQLPRVNVGNSRPRRQRRAPNRLNIGSTKGSSYNN